MLAKQRMRHGVPAATGEWIAWLPRATDGPVSAGAVIAAAMKASI
jgi:hypothetical protein